MPFLAKIRLRDVPSHLKRDPPFRQLDFKDEYPLVSMAAQLRSAWLAVPREDAVWDPSEEGTQGAVGLMKARMLSVRAAMADELQRSEEERAAAPKSPDTDPQTAWRKTIYHMWMDLIPATSFFMSRASQTCGHWHHELLDTDPEASFGHIVLYHGQQGSNMLKTKFTHNVFVVPAFIDTGVDINCVRLPTGVEGDTYVLEDKVDLDSLDAGDTTTMWFIRRNIPLELTVEPSEETPTEAKKSGVAAVLVYANLCTKDVMGGASKAAEDNFEGGVDVREMVNLVDYGN